MTTTAPTTTDAGAAPGEAAPAKPAKRGASRAKLVGVLAIAIAGAAGYVVTHRGLEATDDAQIDGDLVAIPARTSGVVVAIHFQDNQPVKAGDLLAEIDPEPAKARLAQAEAELASALANAEMADAQVALTDVRAHGQQSAAKASLEGAAVGVVASADQIREADAAASVAQANQERAAVDLERIQRLFAAGSVAQAELDRAKTTADATRATLDQAKAHLATLRASTASAKAKVSEATARLSEASAIDPQIAVARAQAAAAKARVGTATAARDLAKLELSYTRIVAPADGLASKRSINVGQFVTPGTPALMLVPSVKLWVTANFKETQIERMRVGAPARFTIDAYGSRELEAEVESFSGATGARFALLPPDNATGNFTKVVQRVPVRLRIKGAPADLPIRPGMSVEAVVDTRR
jgi:membrane fusion protein (multidrug efflux system)